MIGQNHRIIKSGYHPKEFFSDLWKTIASGKVWTGEIKNRAKDGTFYWVFTTIVPFFNKSGKPYKYVSVRTEITEMKKMKEEQTKALLEVERAKIAQLAAEDLLKRKTKFLDIAAHELRTPITTLTILLQLVDRQTAKGQPLAIDILAKFRAPINRLAKLVVDLLEMSRLERKSIVLRPVKTNMALLISECVEEFRVLAPSRRFLINMPNQIIEINVDPVRINQVLTTLLDNAVKYTKDSVIEVTLEAIFNMIRVSVIDHGPGIPKIQKANLFTSFDRGTTDDTIRAGGLGLGLSFCRGIINLHGGTMGVESEEGKGSTFYFELPKMEEKK